MVAILEFKSAKPVDEFAKLRKLCIKNLESIKTIDDNTDFSDVNFKKL